MEHEAVPPLIAARTQIEQSMNELRTKLSILSKKREAIQCAIDVLRSTDSEISVLPTVPRKRRKIIGCDVVEIENSTIEILKHGPMALPDISAELIGQGMSFSIYGLRRILATCPQIKRTGERDQTRYSLNGAGAAS